MQAKGTVNVFNLKTKTPAEIYNHSSPFSLPIGTCLNSSLMTSAAGAVDPENETAKFFIADTIEGRFIFVVHNVSQFKANGDDTSCPGGAFTDFTSGKAQVRFDFHAVPGPGPFPELIALGNTADYNGALLLNASAMNPLPTVEPGPFACRVLDDPNQELCNSPSVSGTAAAVVITQTWDPGRTDGAVIGPIPPGCGWTVDVEYKPGGSSPLPSTGLPQGLTQWKVASAGGSDITIQNSSPTANKTLRWQCIDDPKEPPPEVSYTQGFYGASPTGEAMVAGLINDENCDDINTILTSIGANGSGLNCVVPSGPGGSESELSHFLTGTLGAGKEVAPDIGFLPSGSAPSDNLAAQKITALLNIQLELGISVGNFLNIDVVGGLDPILTTGGQLGTCVDGVEFVSPPDGICDAGTVVLNALGDVVVLLDAAGTTVGDVLAVADTYIETAGVSVNPTDTVTINGVDLTVGQLTKILGMINESYDAGTPTGFVTVTDVD